MDPLRVNPVTEEFHHGLGEHTHLHVDCHVVLTEAGKDLPEVVRRLLNGLAAYQDVIYVHKY